MTQTPTRRFLTVVGNILLVIATSLSVPLWPTIPASATVASPGSLGSTPAPSGTIINSPWLVDSAGTEWAYGTTSSSIGTLISRDRTTGQFTSRAIVAGDEGSLAGLYSPLTNTAVFSSRRAGAGNRIVAFDLSSGARISSRALALDENNIRAMAFNNTADSYIIGTNQSPAKVMKFGVASGAMEYSSTLGAGLNEITAFIPSGLELLAAVNTNPVKLVTVTRNKLVVGSVYPLATGTPSLLDPVVVGNTAYLGTDATPGRITAIDIPTKTVVGSVTLNTGESGARNLVVDQSTSTLYATTESSSGPRIASFRLTDLNRLGTTQISTGSSATSLLLYGRTLVAGFGGNRGIETFTVAPEPRAPNILSVGESDSSLTVTWSAGSSEEPIRDFTASAAAGASSASCTASGTTCTIHGLNNGTVYAVSVVSRSAAGVSQAATSSGMPHTVPSPPTTPQVTRGNSEIAVEWNPQGDGGKPIIGYRAVAMPSGQECETVTLSCTITELTNGVPQTVQVNARNSVGMSLPSEPSSVVTPATLPNAPISVFAVRQSAAADITWSAPSTDGGDTITVYRVYVHHGNNQPMSFDAAESPFTIDGLENGVPYSVNVTAVNSVGESLASESVEVTPAATPDPPRSVIAAVTDGGANLGWSPPTADGGDPVGAYRVRIWHEAVVVVEFDTTALSTTVSGLINGVDYRATVSALNSVGESIASEPAFLSPLAPPVIEPPIVEPPIVEPPIVEPPIVEPPIVEPPIVDPPVVEPPTTFRRPGSPVDVTVISASRKLVTVGWNIQDSGGAPVLDFIVHTSRYRNKGFTISPDSTSSIPRVEVRKPRRGSLYVRVVTVTSVGESLPSPAKRIVR